MRYKILAKTLNLGLGERYREQVIEAENIEKAIEKFYQTYMTIEIIKIEKEML